MAIVTFTVRTFGLGRVPASERLFVEFEPSGAGFTNVSAFPARTVRFEPDDEGYVSANLAPTVGIEPEVWFVVRFVWFELHPITDSWVRVGHSEVDGKLRVTAEGGTLGDLLEAPAPPGVIKWGYGPPPASLTNTLYVDISGMKLVAYGPSSGGS